MPSNTANDNSNLMFYCKCFSPRPANWLSPAASLLFTAWSLLAFTPMYNTQWSLGLTGGVTPAPNYVKACSHKMILDSSSRSNCQPVVFFFHSNYTKCIISILSCCHKHFRLGAALSILSALRGSIIHIDERWWVWRQLLKQQGYTEAVLQRMRDWMNNDGAVQCQSRL